MFKRYLLYVAFGLALSSLFAITTTRQAQAAGERHSWQSYSKIGGNGGTYSELGSETEGGAAAIVFTQDQNDPNKFTAAPKKTNCDGTLTLTLAADGRTGNIVIDNCPLLNGLTTSAVITNPDIVQSSVKRDLAIMKKDFTDENCKAPETPSPQADERLKECKDAAQKAYDDAVASCSGQYSYETATQLSNKFLTCVAEKLCVDRPAEEIESKDPKSTQPKCTLADIGWIVCQIMQLESWISDRSFELLSTWLEIDPITKEVVQNQTQQQNNPTGAGANPNTTQVPTNPTATPPDATQDPSQNTADTPVNTQLPVTQNNETAVYTAWKFFLGMTNIFFVAVFLAIIISYITGWGISNYNIKKILPRFIAAAILSVLSFWICALAIDLSNVIGKTAKDTLVELTPINSFGSWTDVTQQVTSMGPSDDSDPSKAKQNNSETSSVAADQNSQNTAGSTTNPSGAGSGSQNGNNGSGAAGGSSAQCTANIPEQPDAQPEEQGEDEPRTYSAAAAATVNIAGVAIAGTAALFALLAILVPFMAAALIAIVVTLLTLMLRYAIIIVLVVISPIAFVLILFPNTKSWFDKWRTTFTTLLLLYPAIALIYGASHFVAYTIYDQADQFDSIVLTIFALTILVVPLFMTPALMKIGGGILTKFTGMLEGSGPVSKLREGVSAHQKARSDRLTGAALSGKTFALNPAANVRKFRTLRAQSKGAVSRAHKDAEKEYYARRNKGGEAAADGLANKDFAKDAREESNASATANLSPIHLDQMRAVHARWDSEGKTGADIVNMARTGRDANGRKLSDVERAAAAQAALNHASAEQVHDIIAASGQMGELARRTLVESIRKSGFNKRNSHLSAGALNDIADGKVNSHADIDKMIVRAAEANAYGGQGMANQTSFTLSKLNELKFQGKINNTGIENLQRSSHMIQNNPKLRSTVDQSKLRQIAGLGR